MIEGNWIDLRFWDWLAVASTNGQSWVRLPEVRP